MFASKIVPVLSKTAGRQPAARLGARRGYASAPAGASSNLPLYLGGAGIAGLAGYIYIDRTNKLPQIKAEASHLANEAESKLQAGKSEVKSTASDLSSRASALSEQAKDKAQEVGAQAKQTGDSVKEKAGEVVDEIKHALIKDQWVDFKFEGSKAYNDNTSIYTFSFPTPDATPGGKVASALLVKGSDEKPLLDEKGKPVIRPYTPISQSNQKGKLDLMVKVYPEGKMSQHIAHLQPGDTLAFKGPIQKYVYQPNEFEHGVCVGGGSGITPMYQMISHAMELKEDKTQWTLIYANVAEKDILLRKEWDTLAKENPGRFKVVYTLDKPPYFWKGEKGFVSKEVIEKYLPTPEKTGDKIKFFLCGPPGQVNALGGPKDGPRQGPITGVLGELQYDNDAVFKF